MAYPNPLFDTSFKITMQDTALANKVLSALLSKKVTLISPSPQDYQPKAEKKAGTQRLDYVCIIDDEGVSKKVMVELQRIPHVEDFRRFRRYLGFQMMIDSKLDASYEMWKSEAQKAKMDSSQAAYERHLELLKNNGPLEIITIYLLNFTVGIESSMFESPDYFIDCWTKKPTIKGRIDSEFCRLLQHKMYVVQFPLIGDVLDTIGEKENISDLKYLMELWLTGAQNDSYELYERHYHGFKGLGQEVYQKLYDSYESDEEIRFKIMDKAKSEQEFQEGVEKMVNKRAKERAKDIVQKVEQKQIEAEQKQIEAEQKQIEAEQKQIEAEQELKNNKIEMALLMLEMGKTAAEIVAKTKLSESEIIHLKNK